MSVAGVGDTACLEVDLSLQRGEFSLDLAFAVRPGETVVLVGPSGSGKSTTLRAVAGLARPHSGSIRIGGKTVFDSDRRIDLPPWRRKLGVVFQDYALFPHLSALANVLYGLPRRPDTRAEADSWLEALGIADLAERRPRALSGGQQQRVALARAAMRHAPLLLLDEPFGALDVETRRTVRGELRAFLRRALETQRPERPGVLLITHDYLDALTLGDRIAVLERGRLTQVGTREEVLRRPRTPFLASLTGHNVLEGVLSLDRKEVRVGPLAFSVVETDLAPGAVVLSFGPQEITLLRADAAVDGLSARNRYPATVQEIVPLGDRLRVYLDAGVPLLAEIVRPAAVELRIEEGAKVLAVIKSTAIEVTS